MWDIIRGCHNRQHLQQPPVEGVDAACEGVHKQFTGLLPASAVKHITRHVLQAIIIS